MLQPKRTKYRKQFKGRNGGLAQRGSYVSFGEFGLKATEPRAHDGARDRGGASRHGALRQARRPDLDPRVPGRADHQEAARSAHGLAARATSSTGSRKVQPGKVLFEMEGVDEVTAREAFRLAGSKLSVSTSFVKRQVR